MEHPPQRASAEVLRSRPFQVAIAATAAIAFLGVAVFAVRPPHQNVLWTGSIVLALALIFARRHRPSEDCALGVAVILFAGGLLVSMPILVASDEGQTAALAAAALALAAAQMLWAVTRCPCRRSAPHGTARSSLKHGLVKAYGVAALFSLWGLFGRRLYPEHISGVFLEWTVIGYFATATALGGSFPVWRRLLRFPVGALIAGGLCGTILYWSLVPAEIVRDGGQVSWAAAQTHLGVAAVAGFAVGPLVMLHFFFKRS